MGHCGSPLAAQGKLLISPGGKATVAALDPATGKTLWTGAGTGTNYSSLIAGIFGGVEQVVGYDETSLGGWAWPPANVSVDRHGDGRSALHCAHASRCRRKLLVTDQKNETQLFAFGKDGLIVNQPAAKNETSPPRS